MILCVGVLYIHSFIHRHPLSTYYVLAIGILAVSQTDVTPALMNLRDSQQLAFIKPLLYSRHDVKSFFIMNLGNNLHV